jgi:4-amino-4-deoxy-L-arabinose transferase-like glycosyltransferase
MYLFLLLPLFSFLFLTWICFARLRLSAPVTRLRIALLTSGLIISMFIVLVTETLSAFRLINIDAILIAWTALLVLSVLYIYYHRNSIGSFRDLWKPFLYILRQPLVIVMVILLFISLIVAVSYPPNNFDSMTYHMARVAHWEQNQSIAHYRTHIDRQLVYPPFAEWVILHLQIITGGDRFANAVQLFFLILGINLVSLIASELKASRKQQLISGLMACFIPMAVLQSNTTQNDIVVSFYILSFVFFIIRLMKHHDAFGLILAGVSLGISWLTKGTAYIFTLFFCLWPLISLARDYRLSKSLLLKRAFSYCVIPLIAIAINYAHYSRNTFLTGSAFGDANLGTANARFAVKDLTMVAVKNVMNHLPMSGTIIRGVEKIGSHFGVDVSNPDFSMTSILLMVRGLSFHEDLAQNFLHVFLAGLFLLRIIVSAKRRKELSSLYLLYLASILGSIILFCVLLKWQPWSNRLETPVFMLLCVFLGIEVGKLNRKAGLFCTIPVIVYGFVTLSLNSMHFILPISRSVFAVGYQRFVFGGEDMSKIKAYLDAKHVKNIGIYLGSDSHDYPFYKSFQAGSDGKRKFNHVFVTNASMKYVDNFVPDVIISYETNRSDYNLGERTFYQVAKSNSIALFEPREQN